jgi:hypothetical protein
MTSHTDLRGDVRGKGRCEGKGGGVRGKGSGGGCELRCYVIPFFLLICDRVSFILFYLQLFYCFPTVCLL